VQELLHPYVRANHPKCSGDRLHNRSDQDCPRRLDHMRERNRPPSLFDLPQFARDRLDSCHQLRQFVVRRNLHLQFFAETSATAIWPRDESNYVFKLRALRPGRLLGCVRRILRSFREGRAAREQAWDRLRRNRDRRAFADRFKEVLRHKFRHADASMRGRIAG